MQLKNIRKQIDSLYKKLITHRSDRASLPKKIGPIKNTLNKNIYDPYREKQIKAGSRSKKKKLIEEMNKEWKDLYDSVKKDYEYTV